MRVIERLAELLSGTSPVEIPDQAKLQAIIEAQKSAQEAIQVVMFGGYRIKNTCEATVDSIISQYHLVVELLRACKFDLRSMPSAEQMKLALNNLDQKAISLNGRNGIELFLPPQLLMIPPLSPAKLWKIIADRFFPDTTRGFDLAEICRVSGDKEKAEKLNTKPKSWRAVLVKAYKDDKCIGEDSMRKSPAKYTDGIDDMASYFVHCLMELLAGRELNMNMRTRLGGKLVVARDLWGKKDVSDDYYHLPLNVRARSALSCDTKS